MEQNDFWEHLLIRPIEVKGQCFSVTTNMFSDHALPVHTIITLKGDDIEFLTEFHGPNQGLMIKGTCTRNYYINLYKETNYLELYEPYLLWKKGFIFSLDSGKQLYIFLNFEFNFKENKVLANISKLDKDLKMYEEPYLVSIESLKEVYQDVIYCDNPF